MDLLQTSFKEISSAVKTRKVSALEVGGFFWDRIQKLDQKLNAFITRNSSWKDEAENIDKKISRGEDVGPLAGIPFGIKDMFCTQGIRTTAGSRILENFVPPYDSTVTRLLKNAGVVILGKLNLDEFAMGSSNETSYFGPCKNPWNLDFVPGGSSGGSAAAQAARLVAGTVGTDTGGSIRQPASFCGVVGVKPTYGRISRYGIVAYASSLDQAGPMVSTVEDAALCLDVLCGHDPLDSTTSQRSVPAFVQNLKRDMKGVRVGLMKEYMSGGLDSEVEKAVSDCLSSLKKAGAEVVEVSVPLTEFAVPMYYLVATSEASSNLARYDGVKYGYRASEVSYKSLDDFYSENRGQGFGKEVRRRIILGTYCLSSGYYDAYYNKASQVRRLLTQEYGEAFQKCDVILSPVSSTPAFKLGGKISDPLAMYLNDIFTTATNLAGLPGLSVPWSIGSNNLPIGIQLTANHFNEQSILNVALAIEEMNLMKGRVPDVF